MKILIVVIPCYNSEAYMDRAIKSALIGSEDLEILIIDDGSRDNTTIIVNEYEKRYPNIVRAISKENGGHGDAINTGLKYSRGVYFKVLDSDDWLDKDSLEQVISTLKNIINSNQLVDMFIANYVYENAIWSFLNIPFNDASLMRMYKSETLTWILRMVYNNGFVLPVLLPIYRAAISKDFKKMIRYAFSGHIFQVFLITPFYLMFHLQKVCYVLGHPDGLNRHLTPEAASGITLNCFPSMHTSIAFDMFLLVIREKNRLFKYIWGGFCLSVIFSTMYLEIHWIIDVLAGMLLAYCTVKLVDFVLEEFLEMTKLLL